MTINLTDTKPVACGGEVMRRTDSHIINNSKINLTRSGDLHISPPKFNLALTTYPDSDPRWGVACTPEEILQDWEEAEIWDELELWLL